MIQIESLHKSFAGAEVLRGASLRVREGEIVALIGPSGDGKSVFLKHVAGLMRPDSGSVVFNGRDLSRLSRRELAELRSRIGFLFQGGALFDSMTVFDNVAFPLREKTRLHEREIRSRVLENLEQVGLLGAEDKFPAQLSGGMAKRVALARALILSPEVMLFDEPTAGLDPIIVNSILALIASTQKRLGFGGILVTHEIPAAFAYVQKVAMLSRGAIEFVGTPHELLACDKPAVREFIHGSLPPEGFRFADLTSAGGAAQLWPEGGGG